MILKYKSDSNNKQAVRAYSLLIGLSMKDIFDVELKKYTESFQKTAGLVVDGIVGPKTLAKLVSTLPNVRYKDYSGNNYVRAVQALVGSTIDGKYGNNTRANVIAFQSASGLQQTGEISKNDWLALWDLPYDRDNVTTTTIVSTPKQPIDYKQYDSRWRYKSYTSTGNSSQTIGSSGCGPTAMADIVATWKDKKVTPVEMCSYAINKGYRTKNSGTAWDFFRSIAGYYGFSKFIQTKSMATARSALREGALVVASMAPGYWTKGGHFICLWKTDDTYIYANDPASSVRKKQKISQFEKERKQFFIFYK